MMGADTREEHSLERLPEAWHWSAERIKKFGYRVVDEVANHITSLPQRPVFRPFPRELADRYLAFGPAPESGETEDQILEKFLSEIEPFPFGNGHPSFFGWVNSPPAVISIFAEMLAATMNPSCAGGNHAAIYVERQVVNWFKHLVGFPPDSMGLLVSGASMAALTALAVARHSKCGFDIRSKGMQSSSTRLLLYKTGEAHGCFQKAVELLGIGSESIRTVENDSSGRMRPGALDALIRADFGDGHRPFCVIANAGTVNTGAIDPLGEIADICARFGVWLHVDGAYGAPAILSQKYAQQLAPLSRADSIGLDPHKWLYIPVEAGLIIVRDTQAMRETFSLIPPYLRTDGKPDGVWGLPWFSEFGFQQTRGFRALKVWMALRHHGIAGYRSFIQRDIELAGWLAAAVRNAGDFQLHEPQSLSIVCFRYAPARLRHDADALDSLNKSLLERVQLSREVFLSSTLLQGTFWLRACIINPRTTIADIDNLIQTARKIGDSLLRDLH